MGDSLESGEAPEERPVPTIPVPQFLDYLTQTVKLHLNSSPTFDDPENLEAINKFLADSLVPTLLVQRTAAKG